MPACGCIGQPDLREARRKFAGRGEVLAEGWLLVTCSDKPNKQFKQHARFTADALSLFDVPPQNVTDARELTPNDTIWLSSVMSLTGKAVGSDTLRFVMNSGLEYQLQANPPDTLEFWAPCISQRLEVFRDCQAKHAFCRWSMKRSIKINGISQAELVLPPFQTFRKIFTAVLPCIPQDDFAAKVSSRRTPYRGKRNIHSTLVDVEALTKVTHPDMEDLEGTLWTEEVIAFLRKSKGVPDVLEQDFCTTVQHGVPDALKKLIWPLAIGAAESFEGKTINPDEIYKRLLARAFGDIVPDIFKGKVPTFANGMRGIKRPLLLDDVVTHLHVLNNDGKTALKRLLWCVSLLHTDSEVDYCPMLPNLIGVLLVFFQEAQAMVIVEQLFDLRKKTSHNQLPSIILDRDSLDKQAKLFVKEAKKKSAAPVAMAHLEQLGVNLEDMAARILEDGLASKLPLRHFCRVVGCLLAGGSESILRYGIALLLDGTDDILKCDTAGEARMMLGELGRGLSYDPDTLDRLTKVAFSLSIEGKAYMNMSSIVPCPYLADDKCRMMLCRPRLFEPRGSCPEEVWQDIWSCVPRNFRILDPRLVYSSVMHGRSLRTLLKHCQDETDGPPMIFFVYTIDGDIVGGVSPIIWTKTSRDTYIEVTSIRRPVSSSSVFGRDNGCETKTFSWASKNQFLFLASDSVGLLFGGDDVAVHVNTELNKGSTAASASFDSPVLLENAEFEVANVEVFALK